MKKLYYKLNENDAKTQTLYFELPNYFLRTLGGFNCEWISTTNGRPITSDAYREPFAAQIAEILSANRGDAEECDASDYAYTTGLAQEWGIFGDIYGHWYAVQRDGKDENLNSGTTDWEEAVKWAKCLGDKSRMIELDCQEEDGTPKDAIFVAKYYNGKDF